MNNIVLLRSKDIEGEVGYKLTQPNTHLINHETIPTEDRQLIMLMQMYKLVTGVDNILHDKTSSIDSIHPLLSDIAELAKCMYYIDPTVDACFANYMSVREARLGSYDKPKALITIDDVPQDHK